MPITPKNIVSHELLGLHVIVIESKNPSVKGMKGEVVKETKNMLYIRADDGNIRSIAKKDNVFLFDIDGKLIKVLGNVLIGRAEERIKRKKKSRWKVLDEEWHLR